MPGKPWTKRELGLLKRANRLYENQPVLIVRCEPELAERGYDSIRIRGRSMPPDTPEAEGLRIDSAPDAVADQIRAIIRDPAARAFMPASLKVDVEAEPVVTEVGTDKTVTYTGRHLRTEQELRDHAGLPRESWECVHFKVNNYQQAQKLQDGNTRVVTLYQTDARFKPRAGFDELADFREATLADMAAHAPTYKAFPKVKASDDPHLLELDFFDVHVGKLAWGPEVDGDHYDSKVAKDSVMEALEKLLARAKGYDVEEVLIPLGNDLFHTDTPAGTTTAGTRQDVDSRPALMALRVRELAVAVIDRAAMVAPVRVVIVPGNHDENNAFMLGQVLEAWYRNTARVTVDCAPTLRKYVRYGVNFIGFTHGRDEKPADLPLLMASERPHDWAESVFRTWHIGHVHKSKETRFTVGDTWNGVQVRVIQSLSGTDCWHYKQGYTKGRRAAEAFLWSKAHGPAGEHSAFVGMVPAKAAA